MTQEDLKEFKTEYRKWLELNDVSFWDAMLTIWWGIFNRKKHAKFHQCYFDGLNFNQAKKLAQEK